MKKQVNREPRAGRTLLAFAVSAIAGGALLSATAQSSLQDGEEIDTTRAALEKWVETRRIISKERRDWELGREVLDDRIEVVSDEIESLRTRIKDTEASISEADIKHAELVVENERLKEASRSLESSIVELEARTLAILKRLPGPLLERIKPLSQQIPEDPAETKLSISIRFQNVIGILNAVNKFNLEITHYSEVHDLGGGESAEVTAMYLGLGQSYFANADGTKAGVGRPTEMGWEWSPVNEQAPEVLRALLIRRSEEPAAFVQLPIVVE